MIERLAIIAGGIAGALGVAASARASHGGSETLAIAAQFLLFHAPVLLAIAGLIRVSLIGPRAGALLLALFLAGLALFSGDLAMRALAGQPLFRMAAPLGRAQAVFLTHLHSDHINGLGNLALLRWVGSTAKAPLPLLGPVGTAEVGAGFNAAYRIDAGYRTAHHGAGVAPPSGAGVAPREVDPGVVYDAGGVRITAFAVKHDPVSPAYGYRLDWDGRSVTISGDTAATPALAQAAVGTDILVAEMLNPALVKRMSAAAAANGQPQRAKIFADIIDYHITPAQAGQAAHQARARQLVFTHIVPAVPGFMEGMLVKGASATYSGPVKIAADGDVVTIAADKSITRSNRF